jgi:hypothetical protein
LNSLLHDTLLHIASHLETFATDGVSLFFLMT